MYPTSHPGKIFRRLGRRARGCPRRDGIVTGRTAQINRTETTHASRAAIRELFARHMAGDANVLVEHAETGKKYRYMKAGGEDHFSFAFTYPWMAASDLERGPGLDQLPAP